MSRTTDIVHFLEKENMNLLWEVLLDELDINCNNELLMHKIRVIFTSNMDHFVSSVSKNKDNNVIKLVELNKQFLSQIILAVNKILFPTNSQMKKIIIANEEINEPYKIEDIHLSRQNDFESQVEKKRIELDTFMTPQKPKALDFSDKKIDDKITAMDSLIAEKMAERELDINTTYTDYPNVSPDTWLKSTKTSVKNDKQNTNINHINEKNANEKKVSWTDNIVDLDLDSTIDIKIDKVSSIFNKLKKTQETVADKQYITQKSMPLPMSELRDLTNVLEAVPIIQKPYTNSNNKDEISKINAKIDVLFNMMTKLQESLDKINNV
jgi:hypothetical protein